MTDHIWIEILAAIPSVEVWNRLIPGLVKENGPEFKKLAQAEAKKRSYVWYSLLRRYTQKGN
jgi:hypothetical protein